MDNYNIDDLVDDKYFHKKINDKLYLSDYQIDVLKRAYISYENLSIRELIYEIDEILSNEDDEELEGVARELEEFYYYNFVNK